MENYYTAFYEANSTGSVATQIDYGILSFGLCMALWLMLFRLK